ncbi:MAG TPA: FimV/HubP family polar landmark protein, partial [Telluria sp.]
YRNKLAGQVANAEPSRAPEASQSAAGRITARVQERPTAANEARDQLRLSRAPAAGAAGQAGSAAVEDGIARERELADATARVKELERNVSELEQLLSVKGEVPAAAPAGELTQTPPPAAQPAATAPAKPKQPATLAKKRTVAEPSLVDSIIDNLHYIGAALLVLLLGGYAVSKRRKKTVEEALILAPSTLGAASEQVPSMFAHTGGQSVDTSNSVFNSSFAPSASQLDTNEVDPVAEADVYIAYGRDAQAEEILKEALRTHPERMPVRLKLLEIYAARKDQRAFETQAGEIYSLTRGTGDDWAQAAALGLTIEPLNPLYAGAPGAPTAAPAMASEQPAVQARDADDGQAASPASMDLDLSGDMATALPVADEAPAAQKEEEHTLDFDLGGLGFEPARAEAAAPEAAAPLEPLSDLSFDLDATAVPAAEAPAAAQQAEPQLESAATAELPDMAFDLPFDTPAAESTAGTPEPVEAKLADLSLDFMPAASAPAAPATPADDFAMADLAREFDLPSAEPAARAPQGGASLPDAMQDLDAMDFDLPAATPEQPAAAPTPAVETDFDADMFSLELPAVDETATPAPAAAAAAPSFDMSGLDLDLPAAGAAGEPTAVPEPVEASAGNMEMETKLDLAIAYQEIGDKEGARELVDEVIKGGTPTQVAKASALREQLV